ARDSGKVEAFEVSRRALRRARAAEEAKAMGVAEQREDDVAPGVEIMGGDEQLPEAWLSEIVGKQLHVSASQVLRFRRGDRRRPANQIPEFRQRTTEQ